MAEVLHIFTSAAVNYLPKVRILCRSLKRYHPEAVVHLALADERPQWLRTEDEPFDSVLEIGELDIPEAHSLRFGLRVSRVPGPGAAVLDQATCRVRATIAS